MVCLPNGEEPSSWTTLPRSNGTIREAEIILLCVRWYVRYAHSSQDLEEMMRERGLYVDPTTISRSRPASCPRTGAAMQTPPQSHQGTVRNHLSAAIQKLDARNRMETAIMPSKRMAVRRFAWLLALSIGSLTEYHARSS